mgnify:CR=1 FL=1
MTHEEAKVYIQYIKVLLSVHNLNEDVLDEALDVADVALGPDTLYKDPRFDRI